MNDTPIGEALLGDQMPGEVDATSEELMRVSLYALGATKMKELHAAGQINVVGMQLGQTALAAQVEGLLRVLVDLGLVLLEAYQLAVIQVADKTIRQIQAATAAAPVIQVASAVKH